MSDWEIHADTEAQLIAVLKGINAKLFRNATTLGVRQIAAGIVTQLTLANGTTIVLNYYKTKMVQSGTRADRFGNTVPAYVAAPGVYLSMRWLSPTGATPPQPPANSGVTLVALPPGSPQFA